MVYDFATRLRFVRYLRGLSKYRLKQLSGVDVQTIRQLENRERKPQLRTVRKLAASLNCHVETLLNI